MNIEKLELLAQKHKLMLSDELINFADDVCVHVLEESSQRIALEDEYTRNRIGHELDVSDEELLSVFKHLSALTGETT